MGSRQKKQGYWRPRCGQEWMRVGGGGGFPGGSDDKRICLQCGIPRFDPWVRKIRGEVNGNPGEGNGNPLQYSCLENTVDRGAWRVTVHRVSRFRQNLATKQQRI